MEHLHLLQYHTAYYFDSDMSLPRSESKSSKALRSLAPRLKGMFICLQQIAATFLMH